MTSQFVCIVLIYLVAYEWIYMRITDSNGPWLRSSPFSHHFLWENLFGQDLRLCTYLKVHTLASAGFLLESKASQLSACEGPTDSSAWKAGPPSLCQQPQSRRAGAGVKRASWQEKYGPVNSMGATGTEKQWLSLFLIFINPKIHKCPLSIPGS